MDSSQKIFFFQEEILKTKLKKTPSEKEHLSTAVNYEQNWTSGLKLATKETPGPGSVADNPTKCFERNNSNWHKPPPIFEPGNVLRERLCEAGVVFITSVALF